MSRFGPLAVSSGGGGGRRALQSEGAARPLPRVGVPPRGEVGDLGVDIASSGIYYEMAL